MLAIRRSRPANADPGHDPGSAAASPRAHGNDGRIPLLVAQLPTADDLIPYLRQIDQNRWYTNFGPMVQSLEARLWTHLFADARGSVVTTSSGTAALELALSAMALPPGSRVLVPALTFVATATAILRAGCRPVIADVDPCDWLLSPETARACLRRHRADAVMPVATFGHAQDPGRWDAFVSETGVPVLIDAAGAFGNQAAGERCHVAFSMHATKAFAAGEGGFVATCDDVLAEQVRRLSNFGIDRMHGGQVFEAGANGKLSEYHAAVAHASLDRWLQTSHARRSLRRTYLEQLAGHCPRLTFQPDDGQSVSPVLVGALPAGSDAAEIREALVADGIETRQWYCPTLDRHPAFKDYAPDALPVAQDLSRRLLGLPFFVDLDQMQIRRICTSLSTALAGNRR